MIESWRWFGPFAKITLPEIASDDPGACARAFAAGSCIRCTRAGFGGGIAASVLHWLEKPVLPPPETATGVALARRAATGDVA